MRRREALVTKKSGIIKRGRACAFGSPPADCNGPVTWLAYSFNSCSRPPCTDHQTAKGDCTRLGSDPLKRRYTVLPGMAINVRDKVFAVTRPRARCSERMGHYMFRVGAYRPS